MPRAKNPYLKSAHHTVEYEEDQIAEFKKCMDDPIYFITNYCYLQHTTKGKQPFVLYDYQKRMLKGISDNRLSIILASRQVGKSQTIAAYVFWYATFHKDKTILVASNINSNAMELIHRIKYMYENSPMWLKPGLTEDGWNKHSVSFDTGSRILSQATTENTGRGLSISLLICDEFAHIKTNIQERFWTSISPTLSTGGQCIISSTPNGDKDIFSTLWRGAENKSNEYFAIRVAWDEPPGRDDDFKYSEITKIGLEKWRQEYECEFLSSEATLINQITLAHLTKEIDKIEPYAVANNIIFWKRPMGNKTYLVALDPSQGTGNDFSSIEIFEFPSMEQVGEFRSNNSSTPIIYNTLKRILKTLEQTGSTTYFTVENNTVGEGIHALYQTDEFAPENSALLNEKGYRFGMRTTPKSKLKACISLKDMIENGTMKIRSKTLLNELKEFARSGGSYAAKSGSTDDCVSATLLIIRMIEEMSSYDQMAYDKIYAGINQMDSSVLDFGKYKEESNDSQEYYGGFY